MTRRFPLLAFALVTSSSALAAAQEPAREASETLAIQKFDEGRKALEANDYAGALGAFETSNQLLASPNSLLYMARCYKALGRVASAYTTFRLATMQAQDRLVATGDKRYTATRDTAAKEAAEIEADAPKLAVIVPADTPAGVQVQVNGVPLPAAAFGSAVDTDPGHLVIEARGLRLTPFHEEIDLALAETKRVDVKVPRVPTATMRLALGSRPLGLAVRIDDHPVDPAALGTAQDVDPGRRIVDATAPGYRPFHWERTLANGEAADVDVRLEAASEPAARKGTPRWMFFTAAGVGLGALATGSVLALHAKSRQSDQVDIDPRLRDQSEKDGIATEATIANVFFVAAAVLGAGAGALAFTTDWSKKEDPRSPPPSSALVQKLQFSPFGIRGELR